MKYPDTPELDKMLKVSDDSNRIGGFLAWLRGEKGLSICEWREGEKDDLLDAWIPSGHYPVYSGDHGINRLLAEYYKIDYDEMENERRAILDMLQERANGSE